MRSAKVFVHSLEVGVLTEIDLSKKYSFQYNRGYSGNLVSLSLPVRAEPYNFDQFPPFFDGLLPEGYQLDALLRIKKIDRNDLFSQLIAIGQDMVGAVTVREVI